MTDTRSPLAPADTQIARNYLQAALREGGFGKLTEPRPLRETAESAAGLAFTVAIFAGFIAAMVAVGVVWWLALVLALAGFLLLVGLSELEGPDRYASAYVLLTGAGFSVAWQFAKVGWEAVFTHIAPLGLAAVASFLFHRFELVSIQRTVRATKAVVTDLPLLFPAIALVMFAMILNTEMWQIGNRESVLKLGLLCAFVIIPLTWLLRRELVRSIDKTFEKVAVDAPRGDVVKGVAEHVQAAVNRDAAEWLRDRATDDIRQSFESRDAGEVATRVCAQLSGTFKRRITTRLVLTVVAVGIAAFIFIYGLTVLMVAEEVANGWLATPGEEDELRHLEVAGLALPLGPYVKVAALLAILAGAVFIASIVTTDSLEKFRNAYIEEPATTVLLLAVPYLALSAPETDDDDS